MIAQSGIGSTSSTVASIISTIGASTLKGSMGNPIVAAVGAIELIAGTLVGALHIGEGCGPTCIQATKVVNDIEPLLRQNLDLYETGQIDQATAEDNANRLWNAVLQGCGAIPGAAGKNCVGDRQSGACKWKQNVAPQYPGIPQIGECWNWFSGYIDPLGLPAVHPIQGASVGGDGAVMGIDPLYIGLGLLALGLVVAK